MLEQFPFIKPDPILRASGETTLLTTAGIQHLETLENQGVELQTQKFHIIQPVIRSQFMDKIQEGFSTSFLNTSTVSVGTDIYFFTRMCGCMIQQSLELDDDIHKYHVTIHTEPDCWGEKIFSKLVVTLFYQENEISEGVFIRNFPKQSGDHTSISEICQGQERFLWAHGINSSYFINFQEFYDAFEDIDKTAQLIDPIRTAVLMLMRGVTPSHKDPGFRLRKLLRKYTLQNLKNNYPTELLTQKSYRFWTQIYPHDNMEIEQVLSIIEKERQREVNNYIKRKIKDSTGRALKIDINLSNIEFIQRIQTSPLKDEKKILKLLLNNIHV